MMWKVGDFNAHPQELFFRELLGFCSDQSWLCADVKKLGISLSNYTFCSEAHGTRRWLDHCVVSVSAWHTVINVEIKEDVYMSDHLPIFLECDLGVVRYKNLISDLSRSAVTWGERDNAQINSYRDLCNNYLKGVDFPQELASCCHRSCSLPGHKLITT
ncbi:unnamed protein product [Pieris macdunnoughi]|uniref:Endonuclease/exonuclease/phosphatase domain-containing protein n=1 Tax=Pieris macdunnoughi TaxID=345717 RepID=A0A821YGY5_9NEOP|nr:unnamed protein product [Pieris macdunnoughi]